MFFLKEKVQNKNRVEGSISAQYIHEENATFCSKYFSLVVEMMYNHEQRNDDMGVEIQNGVLFVFCSSARPFGKAKERPMTKKEKEAAEIYILDNCDEMKSHLLSSIYRNLSS